jgi:osmotically inducible protein OsmC
MAGRIARADWTGGLANGRGQVSIAGETLGLAYTPAWLQEGAGINPEELLAAAHAASFAMALQAAFSRAGRRTDIIRTRAELHLDRRAGGWTITRSDLVGQVTLEDEPSARELSRDEFQRIVEETASNCPVSCALAGLEITVHAGPAGRTRHSDPTPDERRQANRHGVDDGRKRRAFQGEVISRMRTQARRRPAFGAVARRAD